MSLFADVEVAPARCGGRGYFIVPADRAEWDVDNLRVECRGCLDCKPAPKRPTRQRRKR